MRGALQMVVAAPTLKKDELTRVMVSLTSWINELLPLLLCRLLQGLSILVKPFIEIRILQNLCSMFLFLFPEEHVGGPSV